MQLIEILPSNHKNKRFMARFKFGDQEKFVHFGAPAPDTFIDHGDKERRRLFLARTQNYPTDPFSAAQLSRQILWNTKSMKKNIEIYKKVYNL